MKNYTMFNYEYLFSDHFAKISNQAKLYFIKLNFFANNGFVANPLEVLDSLGYDKGVLQELINNDEILTIPDRSEVFISSYFIHNKGIDCYAWRKTWFAIYWENKLYVKKNGVVKFDPEGKLQENEKDPLDKIIVNPLDASEKTSNDNDDGIDVLDYIKGGYKDEEL